MNFIRVTWVLALLFCLASASAIAQPEPPDVNFRLDDYNIRHHLHSPSMGLFGFTGVWGYKTVVVWNSEKKHYGSKIEEILKYQAIAKTPYRTVTVRHYAPKEYRFHWLFEKTDAGAIKKIDAVFSIYPLQDSMLLRYDNEGRLVLKIRWSDDSDSTFMRPENKAYWAVRRTVDSFSYGCNSAGYTTVNWDEKSRYQLCNMSQRDSASYLDNRNCGNLQNTHFVERKETSYRWEIGDHEEVISSTRQEKNWVNICPQPERPFEYHSSYTYDALGRPLTEHLSLVPGQPGLLMETHVYRDEPISYRFGPLQVPLMRQYLDKIVNPRLTIDEFHEYTYNDNAKALASSMPDTLKPYDYHNRRITVNDASGQRLRFDSSDFYKAGVKVFVQSRDALGSRTCVWLHDVESNTDDAVYNPQRGRISRTFSGGCQQFETFDRPDGAFTAQRISYSDRIVSALTNGWQRISYGPDRNGARSNNHDPLDYWAPAQTSPYLNAAEIGENFILLDAQGLVRYIYNEGQVYQLTYE
jgi:hypothetical protein